MLSLSQTRLAFPREEVGTQEELTPGPITAGQAVTAAGIMDHTIPRIPRDAITDHVRQKGARRFHRTEIGVGITPR